MPADTRVLPDRIILVRHAQSEGNVNQNTYTYLPDPQVPLVSWVSVSREPFEREGGRGGGEGASDM